MKLTEKQLATTSVISIVGLLFIWVVPNTIGLRHFFLVVSFLSALQLIFYNWSDLRSAGAKKIPLFCIFSLFIWVLIHYSFFSLNPELELSEIKGVWMRSLLGAVAAVGLGISIVRYPGLRIYFYVALFSTPFINVVSYIWASYLSNGLVKPNDFVRFLFTKIETAFFGAIATAVAVGNLIYLTSQKIDKSTFFQILFWLFGIALVLVSAVVSSTKNGVAIALGLCIFLALYMLIGVILSKGGAKIVSGILLILVVGLSVIVCNSHKLLASSGWDTIFQDAAIALDIDQNKQWQKTEGSVPIPLNSLGVPAATNTYSRFAYAAVGLRLISKYPMGYGSINRSFSGLQTIDNIPHEHQGQVHSGWIDFGLAFGIPGLLLIFSAILSMIYFGLKNKNSIALPWAMVCLTLIPFGLIAEISYKQYFEATIFFIVFSATILVVTPRISVKPEA